MHPVKGRKYILEVGTPTGDSYCTDSEELCSKSYLADGFMVPGSVIMSCLSLVGLALYAVLAGRCSRAAETLRKDFLC